MAALARTCFLADLVPGKRADASAEQRAAQIAAGNGSACTCTGSADHGAFLLRLLALDEARAQRLADDKRRGLESRASAQRSRR